MRDGDPGFGRRMLPYVRVDDLVIFGLHLHAFGLLVVLAIAVGSALAKRQARRRGYDLAKLESFIGWMLLVGFVFAHALDELLYRPHLALAKPWTLLFFWQGIGSFSGFVGALVGVVLWRNFDTRPFALGPLELTRLVRRQKPLPILPFADVILSVFPVAWIFGRSGCSLAHDHPGVSAPDGALLAVAYPAPDPAVIDGPGAHAALGPIKMIAGQYPRYDLGFLELAVTIVVALACVALWRKRRAAGTYVVLVCATYAPLRFGLDFLRIQSTDVRYAGLTPAQWLCIVLFVFTLGLLRHVMRLHRSGIDPALAVLDPAKTPGVPTLGG